MAVFTLEEEARREAESKVRTLGNWHIGGGIFWVLFAFAIAHFDPDRLPHIVLGLPIILSWAALHVLAGFLLRRLSRRGRTLTLVLCTPELLLFAGPGLFSVINFYVLTRPAVDRLFEPAGGQ